MHTKSNPHLPTLHNEKEEVPLTFKDFTGAYSWPNMGSLRKMAFESEINGLKQAFLKIGRRRLVLPTTLFHLLREMGSK
jgi:hypothetical protein